ncbi:MAG: hypothetical protein ABSG15_03725 [FCB group bacterium]|jgi:hypothetical protein
MKKVSSRFSLFLLAVLLIGISGFFMACEGPAGPAGTNGTNGNATCGACHSNTAADFNLKWTQFELSLHNTGTIYESESGNLGCDGCHTSEGFIEAASLGVNDAVSQGTGKLTCRTCHNIHTKYDSTDFSRRVADTLMLTLRQYGPATVAPINQHEGTICAKCHQARSFVRTVPDTIKPNGTATYSRFGPHYGVVANVVTMNGPYPISGNEAGTNPHALLPKGCVTCHMGKDTTNPAVGGHSFKLPFANLSKLSTISTCTSTGCHNAATIQSQTNAKQVAKDLATYRGLLMKKNMLDTTQTVNADGTYNILGEYPATPGGKLVVYQNKEDVDVLLNYLYLAKDRSNGVHNMPYVQALIKNALAYLNQ